MTVRSNGTKEDGASAASTQTPVSQAPERKSDPTSCE